MKTIEEYESFISKVIYMQLYAPMKDNLYSEEDNLFKIFHDCEEPIFGSCGASRAVYPTESMLEYCSLNASLESVSSGWMKIDDQIDRMERKRREREKEGYNPEGQSDPWSLPQAWPDNAVGQIIPREMEEEVQMPDQP